MPYTFPLSLLTDVSVTPVAQGPIVAIGRTKLESGRLRQRQRFSTDMRVFNIQWWLTDPQFAIFTAFVKWRLNLGNDYFNIYLPFGDSARAMNINATAAPLTLVLARFVNGIYTSAYQSPMWQVGAQLEVETVPGLTSANLTTLGI